ncbi:MAG: hypothetical protein EOM91_17985 [Sphingobacteriia bacterium]|nr:hypothetical protein [Sphingobacteriia bacterium]
MPRANDLLDARQAVAEYGLPAAVLRTLPTHRPVQRTHYRRKDLASAAAAMKPVAADLSPRAAIEALELPTRQRNALLAEGVYTLEQLLALNERTLMRFPRIGRTGIAQIRVALAAKGFRLAEVA